MKIKHAIFVSALFIFLVNPVVFGQQVCIDDGNGICLPDLRVVIDTTLGSSDNGEETMLPNLSDDPYAGMSDYYDGDSVDKWLPTLTEDNPDSEDGSLVVDIPIQLASLNVPINADAGSITYDDSVVAGLGLGTDPLNAANSVLTQTLADAAGSALNQFARVGEENGSVIADLPQAPQYNVTQSQDNQGNPIADQWDITLTDDASGLKYAGTFTVDITTDPNVPAVIFISHKISYSTKGEVGYIDFTTNGKDGDDEEYSYSKITKVETEPVTDSSGQTSTGTVGFTKDVEQKKSGNIFQGQVTEDGNHNITGGNGTLTLADGTEYKDAVVYDVYTLDQEGHLNISQSILGTNIDGATQIWADGATFNYDDLKEVDNRGLDKEALGSILKYISSNAALPFAINLEIAKAMRFSYVQDASGLSPQDLGYSAIADKFGVKNDLIDVGDIVVEIDSSSLPYTLEQIKAAATKAGIDISDTAALKSYVQQLNLRTVSQNKMYFDVNGDRLLYLHQTMSRIELSSNDTGTLQLGLGAKVGDNHLWYSDYGEIAAGMDTPASRLESSIIDIGGHVRVQVSTQKIYKFSKTVNGQAVSYTQYMDVGTFDIYEGVKNEDGSYLLNSDPTVSYEGLDYKDTDGDGVYDTKVYDKMTRVFFEPVQELLSSEKIPRNVAVQETTGYTLDLTTGELSETVRQLDAAGNVLYEHDRKAVMSGGRIISGDDTTKYYTYDESGNLARTIQVSGHYTYDSVTGKYSYNGVTVDGKPAQASYFQADATGVWKLFAQGAQDSSTNPSGPGSTGGSNNPSQQQGSGGQPPASIPPTTNKVRDALSDYVFQPNDEPLINWAEATGRISHGVAEKLREIDEEYLKENREQIQRHIMANAGLSADQIGSFYQIMSEQGQEAAVEYLKSLGLTDEQINVILNPTLDDARMYLLSLYDYTPEEIDEFLRRLNELGEQDALDYLINDMGLSEEQAQDILNMETDDEMKAKLEELDVAITEEEIKAIVTMDKTEFLENYMGYDEWTVNYILNPTLSKSEDVLSVIKEAADKIDFDKTLHSATGDFKELQAQAAQRVKEAVLNGLITPASSTDEVTEILKSILQDLGVK